MNLLVINPNTSDAMTEDIRKKKDGRILILSTHQEEDVALIGGELVRISSSSPDSSQVCKSFA